MSFSYNAALPTNLDVVRMLLGDTVEASALWSDAQLTYFLTTGGTPYEAAALGLEHKAIQYATVVDVSLGNKRMSGSQAHAMLTAQADRMRASGAKNGLDLTPYAAGLSWSELVDEYLDTDIPRPPFGVVGTQPHPAPSRVGYDEETGDW